MAMLQQQTEAFAASSLVALVALVALQNLNGHLRVGLQSSLGTSYESNKSTLNLLIQIVSD